MKWSDNNKMDKVEVMQKLNKIFCEVFDDEDIVLTESTTSEDIEDWDSLEQANLIVEIEKEFHIHFKMSEVNVLKNVGEMVDVILNRLSDTV